MPLRCTNAAARRASLLLPVCLLVASLGTFAPPAAAEVPCPETASARDFVKAGDELLSVDLGAAIAKYEAARASAPRSTRVLAKLARAHEKREAWESALRIWDEAAVLAPRHAGHAFGRARLLQRLERWPEALDAVNTTLALDERHVEAHVAFADVVMHLYDRPARDREAAAHLRRAIELAPQESHLYRRLGDHLFRAGFPNQAKAILLAGLERAVDDAARFPIRLSLADVAQTEGDESETLRQLEAAKASCGDCTEPSQILLPFLLGSAYARGRSPRKAEARAHLSFFMKRVCKGAAAARYADACTSAFAMMSLVAPVP